MTKVVVQVDIQCIATFNVHVWEYLNRCYSVPGVGNNVEVGGVAQRRGCLRGRSSLHAEMLVSPKFINNEGAWSLHEYCSNSRLNCLTFKLPS